MLRPARLLTLGLLLASAACDSTPMAPTSAPDAAMMQTAASFKNAGMKTGLGGLDVGGYCQSQGYNWVGYKKGYVAGPQAAYNNWVCQSGGWEDELSPIDPHPINLTAACQWQYGRNSVQAHPSDPDHAWSWGCYASNDAQGDAREPMVVWDSGNYGGLGLDETHSFAMAKCVDGTLTVSGHMQDVGDIPLPFSNIVVELTVDHGAIYAGPGADNRLDLNKSGNGNFSASVSGLGTGGHEVAVWLTLPGGTFSVNQSANGGDTQSGIPFVCN